eukprot:gene21389-25714_t
MFREVDEETWERPAKPDMPVTLQNRGEMARMANRATITGLALRAAILPAFFGFLNAHDGRNKGFYHKCNNRTSRLFWSDSCFHSQHTDENATMLMFLDDLKAHPEMKIHTAPDKLGFVENFMDFVGLNSSRRIFGN